MTHFTAEEAKARNIEKIGQALGEHYSALWQEVAWLYRKWGEYVELFGTKLSRIDLLNRAAPAFFHMLQDALWENILLHIARLTDPPTTSGKPNLTIRNLSDLSVAAEIQADLSLLINDTLEKTRFCRDWRNRHIAHKDLNLILDASVMPLSPASRQSVRDALAAIVAVLNKIEAVYLESTTFFDTPHYGDGALALLYVIDDGVRVKAERREKMKEGRWGEVDFRPRDL
jgi:hypothetical protein